MSGKVNHRALSKKEMTNLEHEFVGILERCKHKRDLVFFTQHILTKSERVMIGRRVRIAKRLLAGKTQDEIRAEMKVGLATIAWVDAWLSDAMPEYKQITRSNEHQPQSDHMRDMMEFHPLLNHLRNKYPMYTPLINMMFDGGERKQ